jgi:hypothetical protein
MRKITREQRRRLIWCKGEWGAGAPVSGKALVFIATLITLVGADAADIADGGVDLARCLAPLPF